MKRLVCVHLIIFTLLVIPQFSVASDIWVYSDKYYGLSPGDILQLRVGRGQSFPELDERVITKKLKLRVYDLDGNVDPLPLKSEERFWSSEFTVKTDGGYLIAADIEEDFWTKKGNKWLNLPRYKVQTPKKSVAFWYLSKAILDVKKDNNLYKKNLGHPLEIIPLNNPALVKPGGMMRLKTLFQGKPASGITLEATYAGFNRNLDIKVASVQTDQDGIAEIPIPQSGLWYITTKKNLKDTAKAQYQYASYQSNLIFQIH